MGLFYHPNVITANSKLFPAITRIFHMTLYEFRQLTEEQQCSIIAKKAVQISNYQKGIYEFSLFQLYAFYLESRHRVNKQEINLIRTLTPNEIPEVYLQQVDITGCFENW